MPRMRLASRTSRILIHVPDKMHYTDRQPHNEQRRERMTGQDRMTGGWGVTGGLCRELGSVYWEGLCACAGVMGKVRVGLVST
jgi:hypothetical protein